MNYKLTTILVIVKCVLYTVSMEQSIIASNYDDHFQFDCDLILPLMNFIYNQRCIQFISGHRSMDCIANMIQHSENITYFIRSMPWLLNRNIYIEESKTNVMNKKSIKYCEHFLIFMENVSSLQSFMRASIKNISQANFLPFSKLFFIFEDKNAKFIRSEMTEVSTFLYERAQFGYVIEYHSKKKTLKLRDLLSSNYTENNQSTKNNLNHPFVNRENRQKEFRISFHQCHPYVIYVDVDNLR